MDGFLTESASVVYCTWRVLIPDASLKILLRPDLTRKVSVGVVA